MGGRFFFFFFFFFKNPSWTTNYAVDRHHVFRFVCRFVCRGHLVNDELLFFPCTHDVFRSVLFFQGNECVDVKEGTMDTIIETNYCTGQLDEDSAGIDSRASTTIIRYNKVVGCEGAGVRLGGHKVGSDQYGIACQVGGTHFFCAVGPCLAEGWNSRIS